jgi:hypothetical protein
MDFFRDKVFEPGRGSARTADAVLVSLVKVVEVIQYKHIPVTLYVNGFIITGELISFKNFFEMTVSRLNDVFPKNEDPTPFDDLMRDFTNSLSAYVRPKTIDAVGEPVFLQLQMPTIIHTNSTYNVGLHCRMRIDAVDAWSFGANPY